jgi:hypothetical protein
MPPQRVKSPCCREPVVRFGQRRRQCVHCKKTWSIRPKKRGRPSKRTPQSALRDVLLHGYSLRHLALRRPGVKLPAFRKRFRHALRRFTSGPNTNPLPEGPLILLMDGVWFRFAGKPWVLYLIALRACHARTAVFLDPVIIEGKEGHHKWEQAVATIPSEARCRIRALVVDNLRGMEALARQNAWALQLCQFHLLLKLQVQRTRPTRALRGGSVRLEIYRFIRKALDLPEGPELYAAIEQLRRLERTSCGTKRIRAMVREFLRCIGFYRTCRSKPDLNLPGTTNTVESMGSIVRQLLRNRSGSNPRSVLLWSKALIRLRPHVTCNAKANQQD